jgi:MFS-type transporter involved in bile tolerance (Atg22 family)
MADTEPIELDSRGSGEIQTVNSPINEITETKEVEVNENEVTIAEAREELDKVPVSTKWEIYSYYLYANGANGVGPNNYVPLIFQDLATLAGHDPTQPGNQPCPNSEQCVIKFGAVKNYNVSSVILLMNGISFLFQMVFFVWFGSLCDYSSYGRWLFLGDVLLNWASNFAFLGIKKPSQYTTAAVMNLISNITFNATNVFFPAIFPRLAANTPEVREKRALFVAGKAPLEEVEREDAKARNRIILWATVWSNIGYVGALVVALGPLLGMGSSAFANNAAIAVACAYYIASSMWWFIFQKNRPGPKLPEGEHILVIGWKTVLIALKEMMKLSQAFLFVISYFMFTDGMNTSGSLFGILQNEIIEFSFLTSTYVNLVQAFCSIAGCIGFYYVQRRFNLSIKFMFQVCNFFVLLIPIYGSIGAGTKKIGFNNVWEIWAYQAYFGLFVSPWYAYINSFMSELIPTGCEHMFFSLVAMSGRTSSFVGSYITSAITAKTSDVHLAFPFCAGMCIIPFWIISTISVERSRREQASYLSRVAQRQKKTIGNEEFEILEAQGGEVGRVTFSDLFRQLTYRKLKDE